MKNLKNSIFAVLVGAVSVLVVVGCSHDSEPGRLNDQGASFGLRPLKSDELLTDFDTLVSNVNAYYGPREYKEKRFGYSIAELAKGFREKVSAASSEAEALGYFYQFLAKLDDGHVSLRVAETSGGVLSHSLGLFLTPVAGRALVGDIVDKELVTSPQVEIGDEVLSIDGVKPFDLLPIITKYAWIANPISAQHLIMRAMIRPFYMTEIAPKSPTAKVELQKANGQKYALDLTWKEKKIPLLAEPVIAAGHDFSVPFATELNQMTSNNISQMGQTNPFFLNEKTQAKYGFIKVKPSAQILAAAGVAETEVPDIYAATYTFGGKKILLIRQATYAPEDFEPSLYLAAYFAILKEYESKVDVLVIDQTHNPGGDGSYCTNFFGLLNDVNKEAPVQMCRADRKWMDDLSSSEGVTDPESLAVGISMAKEIEKAYDAGDWLSSPLPIFVGTENVQGGGAWNKPILVLIDELAGSCGDVFPMLIRDNKRAKLFGQRTMGLGGNVEPVVTLPFSQAKLNLTRGLFMTHRSDGVYDESNFVENNGVQPDYPYSHTVEDFRGGFVGFIEQFSNKAVEQIAP